MSWVALFPTTLFFPSKFREIFLYKHCFLSYIWKYEIYVNLCYYECFSELRERPFLMTGTRAEGNCPGYENCSSWDRGVWNPYDVQDRGMKTYSISHPRGHRVRKLLVNFLRGTKLFKPNLRNLTFRTCIVMDIS